VLSNALPLSCVPSKSVNLEYHSAEVPYQVFLVGGSAQSGELGAQGSVSSGPLTMAWKQIYGLERPSTHITSITVRGEGTQTPGLIEL
jgi:hypothetical protein